MRFFVFFSSILISTQVCAANESDFIEYKSQLSNVQYYELPNPNNQAIKYHITADIMVGTNSCFAEDVEGSLDVDLDADVIVVRALVKKPRNSINKFCPEIFEPVFRGVSYSFEISPKNDFELVFMSVSNKEELKDVMGEDIFLPLNLFCDPALSVYMGGTPAFDPMSGHTLTPSQYRRLKGLDDNCKSINLK